MQHFKTFKSGKISDWNRTFSSRKPDHFELNLRDLASQTNGRPSNVPNASTEQCFGEHDVTAIRFHLKIIASPMGDFMWDSQSFALARSLCEVLLK